MRTRIWLRTHGPWIVYVIAVAMLAMSMLLMVAFCPRAEAAVPESWSVETAVQKGSKWGGKKHVKGVKRMFELWYPDYWNYGGGRDAVTQALITWTETGHTGNPLASTADTKLGEAGLLSLKRSLAKTFDLDACDPRQNILGAAKGQQMRAKQIQTAYPWAEKLSDEDRWFLRGMHGGSGAGAAACVLGKSDAKASMKAKKWKGSLKLHVLGWFMQVGDTLKDPQHDPCWGRTNAETVAFRMSRIHAGQKIVFKIYGGGKKGKKRWASCVRPESLLSQTFGDGQYPGDEDHGKCHPTPKKAWDLPPAGHRRAFKGKKKVDLWAPYCGEHEKCLAGDSSIQTYNEAVWPNWIDAKQAEGLLPTDEEYAQAKMEMEADGCWILD